MKPTIEYIEQINTITRKLRKNQTPSEKALWEEPPPQPPKTHHVPRGVSCLYHF